MDEIELRDEAELESIIRRDPAKAELGLIIITDQKSTTGGRLDLLAVDGDGILTLMELKVKVDEGQLQQALNYYDWVLQSIDFIRDAYKHRLEQNKRQIRDEMPRIILIAPDFDKEMLTAAKYVRDDIDLRLLRYKAFNVNGKKEIVTFPIELTEVKEIEEKPKTVAEFLEYIGDSDVCETFNKAIEIFSKLSDEEPVTDRNHYKFRFAGRKFAEVHVRHGYFWIGLKDEDEWFWKDKVKTLDDMKSIREQIKKAIELVGGKFKDEVNALLT
jgi:hypothetical protein